MANEFIIKNGYFSQGSSNVTGSLTVTAGVTASLQGTASWSNNAITSSYIVTAQTASYVLNSVSSSFATTSQTASFVTLAQTASFVTTAQTASYVLNAVSSSFSSTAQNANTASFVTLAQTASFVTTAQTASYVLNAVSASRATSASRADSAVTASYVLNAVSASFASTASFVNTLNQNVTVSGSLTVTNDFTVLGSASILFITSSQLNIADNIISVNTIQPGVRFGGLAVIDSGSTPLVSGSLLFDSQNNQWIFVHQSAAGAAVTSSTVLMGPQTFNNVGSETQLTTNRIPKAVGVDLGEHLNDSNITDTGVLVSINSATQITGSLTLSGGATGSLQGTASWAASASNVAPTSNAFIQGGNSFGTTALLGTNDNQNLNFETNGSVRMSISSSGQVVHGSNPLLILSGGLFEGVSPFMEVQTGVTGGAYNEAVILRHNGIAGTAVTRSLGLLIKLSSENMPAEAPKMGGMILRSTSVFSNSPDLHFVTANTEKMTISNIGNVGIGTTTPNAKLQVVGNITATSVTASLQGTASFATSASNALTASFVNPLQQEVLITGSLIVSASGTTNDFRVGTNDLFVSASGNVGIGTTAPNARLHVSGGAETIRIETSASIGSGPYMTFYGNNTFRGYVGYGASTTNQLLLMNIASGANDSLNLGTNSLIRLTVSSSGEVGIGTSYTSPSSLLSVLAPFESNAFDITNAAETPFKYRIINSGSALAPGLSFKSGLYYNNLENATVNFWRGASTTGGFLTFNTNNGTERMRIDGNGAVGIGTTLPTSSLHIVGPLNGETITADNNDFGTIIRSRNTSATGTPRQFYITHNGGDTDLGNLRGNLNITTGSVGINTNTTQTAFAKFVVRAATNNLFGFASVSSTASIIAWDDTGAGNTLRLAGNPLIFTGAGGAGAEHMRLNSSGELGIGLTPATGFRVAANGTIGSFAPAGSPTGSLYIDHTGVQSWKIGVSASSTSTLSIGNDLGGAFVNKILNLTNAGNIGIGTTTPTQGTLQVVGNVFATSYTGSITGSVTGTLTGTASFATSASFLTSNTNAFIQGGNSFGATALLGTNDTRDLSLETNGTVRMTISGSDGAIGISATPRSDTRLYVTESSKLYGFYTANTANNGTAILGQVVNGTGTSIGVYGQAQSAVGTTNIGLYGAALNATNNYSIQLTDGSEGIGKVLVSQTADGKANWSTRLSGSYEITGSLIVSASGTTNDFRVGNSKLFVSASGNVGIGNTNPPNTLSVSNAGATAATATTYALAVQRSNVTDITLGSDASFSYLQSWSSKPLLLNSQGNNIGINKTTTPNAQLDVNGNTIITGSLSVTSVGNNTGSFVTINGNKTLNSRTAAQVRVDINYYGLTYAMQNGYY